MRSIYCGDVGAKEEGQELTVAGWVHRRRDHGGVIFIDLRDREGLVQVVLTLREKKFSLKLNVLEANTFFPLKERSG